MNRELISIGKTLKTHGLNGALKVGLLTDRPNRFRELKEVILETRNGVRKECTLTSVREEKGTVIITCKEIASIDEAGPFVPGWVKIPLEDATPLQEGEFYHYDLLGISVFLEDGSLLGTIQDIIETGSNDVFIVKEGDKEHLIPALREVVQEIDLKEKRMVIRNIEGLVDHDAV